MIKTDCSAPQRSRWREIRRVYRTQTATPRNDTGTEKANAGSLDYEQLPGTLLVGSAALFLHPPYGMPNHSDTHVTYTRDLDWTHD